MQKICLNIPENLAFISFDEGESFYLFNPTVHVEQQPPEEMGKEVFSVLMDLMTDQPKSIL